MRWLIVVLTLFVCSLNIGCAETPAEKAATGNHPNAHLSRGGPKDGYAFVCAPDERARLLRGVEQLAAGTSANEIIKLLGEPDSDVADFESIFTPVEGRILTYYLAIYKLGFVTEGRDQYICLELDNNNRYWSYFTSGNIEELKPGHK